jgi:glycosyltransferase involved in cell wall biosynthesis
MKPRLLITIYANPDHYPPTVYAVRILSKYFNIHILSRNMGEPIYEWPSDVTIERMGEYGSAREKEAANAAEKLVEYARFVRRTRALIKQMQPLTVYSYDAHAFVASILGRAGRSIPLIFHAHELPETENLSRTSLEGWVVRAALKGTRSADAVVFPEKNRARHWLMAAGGARPPIVVPNCPDQSYFSPPTSWSEAITNRYRAREVVYVGYAGVENGHLEALRAIAMTDGIRLRVIGDHRPEFGERFNALAHELEVSERVSLDGWLSLDELRERASRASVGLSLYKPVTKGLEYVAAASNKLFEYAAMGLPVIVPDRENYRDFLGDAGWVTYADAEQPESIARAITSIFADRERYAAMSRAARRVFEEQYNYEHVFAPALARIFALSGVAAPVRIHARDMTIAGSGR